ncbi:AAA family ATPase [Streptomyces sp. NPDC054796]
MLSRDCETSALDKVLGGATAGMGTSLLLEGGIGTGKSSLLRGAMRTARSRDFGVVAVRGRKEERGIPYAVAHQARDQLLQQLKRPSPADAGADATRTGASASTAWSRDEPETMARELYGLLTELTARRPVLIVVDDVQWVDTPSLYWLGHVMARIEVLPVALLASLARGVPPAEGRQAENESAAVGLTGGFHQQLVLRGLNVDSVGYLLGSLAGGPVRPELTRVCHEVTGGNPLWMHALLREISRTGTDLARMDPERIRDMGAVEVAETLAARFGLRFPGACRVFGGVAVMGSVAGPCTVAELAGMTPESTADLLHALVHGGVLRESDGTVSFRHPLVRTSFLAALSPSEQSSLHARAAEMLHRSAAPSEEVVAHLVRADPMDEPWARELLADAADSHVRRGRLREAGACLRQALAVCEEEDEPRLLHRLGHVELVTDPAGAADKFRRVLELAPRGGDTRATALVDYGWAEVLSGRAYAGLRTVQAEAAEPGGADEEVRLGIRALSGLLASLNGGVAPPALTSPRAAEVRRPWVRRVVSVAEALHAHWRGEGRAEAVAFARQGLADPGGSAAVLPAERLSLATVLSRAGEHAEALAACRAVLAEARASGQRAAAESARHVLGHCALRAGSAGEAERSLLPPHPEDTAPAPASAATSGDWEGSATHGRLWAADTLLELGESEAAQRTVLDGFDEENVPKTLSHKLLFQRGRLHLAAGRTEAGLADLWECGRLLTARGWLNPAVCAWRSEAALAHLALGQRAEAERLARDEVNLARRWGAPHVVGRALRAAAQVAGGRQRTALLNEAVELFRSAGTDFQEAQVRRDLGSDLLRAGKRREARLQLRTAAGLAERSGAARLVAELRRDLADAGAKPRRHAETGPESLTQAERRTALLAAEGLTNQEIADRLYVTRRTVEMHLSRVYRKLCITDRSALAATVGHPSAEGAAPPPSTARATRGRPRPAASDGTDVSGGDPNVVSLLARTGT